MSAKFEYFKAVTCKQIPALMRVLKAEKAKNQKYERKQQKMRASWSLEEHLKFEMAEVFQLLTSVYTPSNLVAKNKIRKLDAITSGTEVDDFTEEHHFIGIYAFRKLMIQGRLLNASLAEVNEFFRNTDITASCYITLEAILPWMRRKIAKLKNFKFRMSDILSAEERAYIAVYLRMLRDKTFLQTANDYNKYEEMKEAKRRLRLQQQVDEWSDDEEDEEEEIDEDLFFSDLEKMRNMDVGRLMRYLTKRREMEQQNITKGMQTKKVENEHVPSLNSNIMAIVNEALDTSNDAVSAPPSPEKKEVDTSITNSAEVGDETK